MEQDRKHIKWYSCMRGNWWDLSSSSWIRPWRACMYQTLILINVLWHWLLVGRQEEHPASVGAAGVVICLERGADLHMAQLIPLPLTVSCFRKIQIGFTFLVQGHLGSPGQRAVVCVCVLQIITARTMIQWEGHTWGRNTCLLYTSPSPRD